MKRLPGRMLLASIAFTGALVACAGNPTAVPNAAAPMVLRYCQSSTGTQYFLPRYAIRSGIFAEFGLDVKEVMVRGSENAAKAMIAGDVDVCGIGTDVAISAAAAGSDLVIIGSFFNRNSAMLLGTSDIRTPNDLKGKKVYISRPHSVVTRNTKLYLAKYGVKEGDVEFVDGGSASTSERVTAMLAGNASALLVSNLTDVLGALKKGATVLIDASQVNPPDRMSAVIVTRKESLTKNREAYKRLIKAMATAVTRMSKDPEGVKAALADFHKLDPKKDADMIDKIYSDFLLKYVDRKPIPSQVAMRDQIDELNDGLPKAASRDPQAYVDQTLIDELAAEGFFNE